MLAIWTISLLAALGATLFFWNHISFFFQSRVVPTVRDALGDAAADLLAKIVSFVDNGAVMTRNAAKKALAWLKRTVLGATSKYTRLGANQCEVERKAYVDQNDGTVSVTTEKCTIPYDELPAKVRAQMIRAKEDSFELDDLSVFTEMCEERLLETPA